MCIRDSLEIDDDEVITGVRIACGGVAHKPWRAARAEELLVGRAVSTSAFAEAADAELADATPVEGAELRVPLLRRTIIAVLRDLAAEAAGRRAGVTGEEGPR